MYQKGFTMATEDYLQCPCGKIYSSPNDYTIVFVKKEQCEIDILCSNPACFLKELGYVKFIYDKDNSRVKINVASFYPPYVTWNTTRLGKDRALKLLETHLREVISRSINWKKVAEDLHPQCLETTHDHEGRGR